MTLSSELMNILSMYIVRLCLLGRKIAKYKLRAYRDKHTRVKTRTYHDPSFRAAQNPTHLGSPGRRDQIHNKFDGELCSFPFKSFL
jgi:hypothetical protein